MHPSAVKLALRKYSATAYLPLLAHALISSDSPPDRLHPAAMTVLDIPSHGVSVDGLLYQPSGAAAGTL
jgi:hypothetical protein